MPRQLFTALVVAGGVVFVVVLATGRATSNPQPTTVAAALATDSSDALSITGYVQRSSRRHGGDSQWRFTLENDGKSVAVRYKGVVPSTFEEGARVMVVGTMQGRTFVATWLGVHT